MDFVEFGRGRSSPALQANRASEEHELKLHGWSVSLLWQRAIKRASGTGSPDRHLEFLVVRPRLPALGDFRSALPFLFASIYQKFISSISTCPSLFGLVPLCPMLVLPGRLVLVASSAWAPSVTRLRADYNSLLKRESLFSSPTHSDSSTHVPVLVTDDRSFVQKTSLTLSPDIWLSESARQLHRCICNSQR